jgi:hypothetical protein
MDSGHLTMPATPRYVSDLTCAFLEDTGYYGCNRDALGSLYMPAGTALNVALAQAFFSADLADTLFVDPFTSEEVGGWVGG